MTQFKGSRGTGATLGSHDRYGTDQKAGDIVRYSVCGHHCTNEG